MKRRILIIATAGVLSLFAVVHSQERQSDSPAPTQAPAELNAQGVTNYLLGPGDVLDVRVFGQPDLSATAEVDSDGNVSSLPFLETPIPAKCRTEKEVQKDIAKAYSKYIKNAQVSVRIADRKSRVPATVFGAVRQPTQVTMKRKVRLNELMTASGGFTERASGTIQIWHTEPVMCPMPGEEADAAPIDGTKLPFMVVKLADLRAGLPQANPVIRPGDYIIVTEAEPVYMIGSVHSPQGIFLRDQLTLSRAIAMVGGVTKEAKASDVRVYRQKPGAKNQEIISVDYAAIKKNKKPDIFLEPYDVVEVGEASFFSRSNLPRNLLSLATGSLGSIMTSGGQGIANRVIY